MQLDPNVFTSEGQLRRWNCNSAGQMVWSDPTEWRPGDGHWVRAVPLTIAAPALRAACEAVVNDWEASAPEGSEPPFRIKQLRAVIAVAGATS